MEINKSMKKMVNNKSGLSPVIASVLLILLVLVLASIIFLWARGFISEQIEKFGEPVENACSDIYFTVERTGIAGSELEISNKGNVDIRHLEIKMSKGGNTEVKQFSFQVDAGESVRQDVTLLMESGEEPDMIVVYPALVGTLRGDSVNKIFTCNDNGFVI